MGTTMVRKQIYIPRRQDVLLKRLSMTRGVSEAEIIRQAIEREISGSVLAHPRRDDDVWSKIMQAVEEQNRTWLVDREPIRWTREELYAERADRWLKDKDGS